MQPLACSNSSGNSKYSPAPGRSITCAWESGCSSAAVHAAGRKLKNTGLYAMITQILAFVMGALTTAVMCLLFGKYGWSLSLSESALGVTELPAEAMWLENFYRNGGLISSLFEIVYVVFQLILLMGLYKKYAPKHYMLLSVLYFFVPFAKYITIFVVRKRAPFDYEGYMRARREEFMRRQYNNPYNNPYGNGYGNNGYGGNGYGNNPYNNPYGNGGYGNNPYGNNPYGNNPYGQAQPPKPPEDPFAEFGGEKANGGGEGSDGSGSKSGDGFFD